MKITIKWHLVDKAYKNMFHKKNDIQIMTFICYTGNTQTSFLNFYFSNHFSGAHFFAWSNNKE